MCTIFCKQEKWNRKGGYQVSSRLKPAETKGKIVQWTIFPTRLDVFHFKPPKMKR